MKKLVFLAALATLGFAAPAYAGSYCDSNGHCTGPSANDWNRVQQRSDPGYHGYNSYGYGGGTLLGNVIACAIGGCGRESRKPKDGELRNLPDGTSVSWDKPNHQWVEVNRPSTQPRGVYSDRDTYVAN